MKKTPEMPTPESSGFIRTLNNMGFMTSKLDEYSKAFVDFASTAPGPVLDIGAAYGVAALAALSRGARVIANDIDPRHLEILLSRVADENERERLTLLPGSFPASLEFPNSSLGAILVCRVLHFFDGSLIKQSAQKMYDWVSPGGKVFVVAETPYLKNFSSFIPTYEKRKRAGVPWPGFIEDVMAIAPERGKALPSTMHLLDKEPLTHVFSEAGFLIEKCELFARPEFPEDIRLDGRESVGLIARKG